MEASVEGSAAVRSQWETDLELFHITGLELPDTPFPDFLKAFSAAGRSMPIASSSPGGTLIPT